MFSKQTLKTNIKGLVFYKMAEYETNNTVSKKINVYF